MNDQLSGSGSRVVCPYCQGKMGTGEETRSCPECGTTHHASCWLENEGCTVYGCTMMAGPVETNSLDIPPAYWGRQDKPCHECGQEIQVAALRCRHCGVTFDSDRPVDTAEYLLHKMEKEDLPGIRRTAKVIFTGAVLPFTAPLVAVFGGIWVSRNRKMLELAGPVPLAMARIGIFVAVGQIIVMGMIAAAFPLLSSG